MKKLVAYSSVAHMGFVTLGFFVFSDLGVAGGIVQMIAHGFVSAAMFLGIGVLYDRVHSREIADYGGVVNTMPKFAAFALLFTMANCGLPGTAGFVGEWMVILAAVKANFWIGLLAASALIFGAAYSLWMYKRVYLGARGQRQREEPHRPQRARVPGDGGAGHGGALHGRVSQAFHRRDGRLRGGVAAPRGGFQAAPVSQARHTTQENEQ